MLDSYVKNEDVNNNVESAGMACEERTRNRMLRKRWIVRNPVVGEDHVTQFILARSFNTSWPHGLFFSGVTTIKWQFFFIQIRTFSIHGHRLTHRGLPYCLCNL